MPSAIHFGLRRPGKRDAWGVIDDPAAAVAFGFGALLLCAAPARGLMSVVIVSSECCGLDDHRVSPVGTMLARAAPCPVTEPMPMLESKIVGSRALVVTRTTPFEMETAPSTPG